MSIERANGEQFLFDLKTAKPNISGFKEFKRTLLESETLKPGKKCKLTKNFLFVTMDLFDNVSLEKLVKLVLPELLHSWSNPAIFFQTRT